MKQTDPVRFVIPGEPRGKGRPRYTKFSKPYTPKETVQYERLVKACYRKAGLGRLSGEIEIEVTACYGIPVSKSKRVKEQMAAGVIRPTKKPDCDNVLKIVCDALNQVAYEDDKQIVTASVSKRYTAEPRVEVELRARGDTGEQIGMEIKKQEEIW